MSKFTAITLKKEKHCTYEHFEKLVSIEHTWEVLILGSLTLYMLENKIQLHKLEDLIGFTNDSWLTRQPI